MLAPSPSTKKGMPAARAAPTAFARSSAAVASYSMSAGPPILNVVKGASGTFGPQALCDQRIFPEKGGYASGHDAVNQRACGDGRQRSVFCAVADAVAAPARVRAQRAELEKTIQRRVMPNGLEVIVVENHGVPLVTVEITVRNGSFTQTPEYAGLAHMFEHMFFKANDTYPNPDQFMDRGSEMGAVFNASTKEEQVNYYLTLSADSMEGGLKFLVSALLAPKFRQDELERERQVVLGEYDRNESSPGFKLEQEMGKKLWDGEWSRKNVIGDRQVIATVTPDKMRYIKDLYYVPNNSVLIISGDVNPAAAFASAEKIFSPVEARRRSVREGAGAADAAAHEESRR